MEVRAGKLYSAEIILYSLCIILTEIIASLYLDKRQIALSGIFNPVEGTLGNIHRPTAA